MSGTIKKLKLDKLVNYYENSRHAIGNDERDTLEKLFNAVGVQYMLNLASDLQKNGLLGNQQIVVVFSEKYQRYIVYEGNRRVAALKLLLNPDYFSFLDKTTLNKIKKIRQEGTIITAVNCYITTEKDAFFIMERLHSGEDKGRGTKQWTSREKETFRVRQNHEKIMSYLIYTNIKQYFNDFDITTILPFTTIQRLFNNREVKKRLGLNVSDESSFTVERMQLIIDASRWAVEEANNSGMSVTRFFNKARTIEDKLLPWIEDNLTISPKNDNVQPRKGQVGGNLKQEERSSIIQNSTQPENVQPEAQKVENKNSNLTDSDNISKANTSPKQAKQHRNASSKKSSLPYFFQGLDYSKLNPEDASAHGVIAICNELQSFSNKKLVNEYPIAATFLTRSIIEQSLLYYAKNHNIQGQNKRISENIDSNAKLSAIISNYNKNLSNYIPSINARQYFHNLFDKYDDTVNPLNWVVHRPSEFQLPADKLIELPRRGLLVLINYLLDK